MKFYIGSNYDMNTFLIRDIKGTVSVFHELTENTHLLEYPKQEGASPCSGSPLGGGRAVSWRK